MCFLYGLVLWDDPSTTFFSFVGVTRIFWIHFRNSFVETKNSQSQQLKLRKMIVFCVSFLHTIDRDINFMILNQLTKMFFYWSCDLEKISKMLNCGEDWDSFVQEVGFLLKFFAKILCSWIVRKSIKNCDLWLLLQVANWSIHKFRLKSIFSRFETQFRPENQNSLTNFQFSTN